MIHNFFKLLYCKYSAIYKHLNVSRQIHSLVEIFIWFWGNKHIRIFIRPKVYLLSTVINWQKLKEWILNNLCSAWFVWHEKATQSSFWSEILHLKASPDLTWLGHQTYLPCLSCLTDLTCLCCPGLRVLWTVSTRSATASH